MPLAYPRSGLPLIPLS